MLEKLIDAYENKVSELEEKLKTSNSKELQDKLVQTKSMLEDMKKSANLKKEKE